MTEADTKIIIYFICHQQYFILIETYIHAYLFSSVCLLFENNKTVAQEKKKDYVVCPQ
jgi:hypothetical protein